MFQIDFTKLVLQFKNASVTAGRIYLFSGQPHNLNYHFTTKKISSIWTEVRCHVGQTFYYNTKTKKSSWVMPKELEKHKTWQERKHDDTMAAFEKLGLIICFNLFFIYYDCSIKNKINGGDT